MTRPFRKRIRDRIVAVAFQLLIKGARLLPRKVGLFLFAHLTKTLYFLPHREKKRARRNLGQVFPDMEHHKREEILHQVYYNTGKNLLDTLLLPDMPKEKLFTIVKDHNFEAVHREYRKGKGIIGISAHIGCFEMLPHYLAKKGVHLFTIGQPLSNPRVDKMVSDLRQRNGVIYASRLKSSRRILSLLRQGYVFALLGDYNSNVKGVFANFLGVPTYTVSGPIRIALRYDIPVFVSYTLRNNDDTHTVHYHGPITLSRSGDLQRDLVINTEKINAILSRPIMNDPSQWLWTLRKWGTRLQKLEQGGTVPHIRHYDSSEGLSSNNIIEQSSIP